MKSILEVKQALVERSRTADLDEFRSKGRSKVRVIRADQIAALISEAVERAVQDSGLVSAEQAREVVEASRRQFRDVVAEREAEVARAREQQEELERLREENAELRRRLEESAESAAGAGGLGQEAILALMKEVAELKANMQQPAAQTTAPDLGAVLGELTGALNERLDKMSRKMGISTAVEAEEVKLDGLFRDEGDESLESNIDAVDVKQKTQGGIGSAVERLKKLKGDA